MGPWCRFVLCTLVALGCELNAALPHQLHGRWVSSDPRYRGRSLVLTATSVRFETGEGASETFAVRGVESERDPIGGVSYAIAYGGRGERELRLHLDYGAELTVRIGDRPERWTRARRGEGA